MAIAASLTKPMKLTSSLSYRVATRRNCLSLLKKRSTDVALLVEIGVVGTLHLAVSFRRDDRRRSGLHDPLDEMVSIIALVGNRHRPASKPSTRSWAKAMSLRWPGLPIRRIGLPSASPAAWFWYQPAPRPAQALGIRPPFSLRAPAAC